MQARIAYARCGFSRTYKVHTAYAMQKLQFSEQSEKPSLHSDGESPRRQITRDVGRSDLCWLTLNCIRYAFAF